MFRRSLVPASLHVVDGDLKPASGGVPSTCCSCSSFSLLWLAEQELGSPVLALDSIHKALKGAAWALLAQDVEDAHRLAVDQEVDAQKRSRPEHSRWCCHPDFKRLSGHSNHISFRAVGKVRKYSSAIGLQNVNSPALREEH